MWNPIKLIGELWDDMERRDMHRHHMSYADPDSHGCEECRRRKLGVKYV